jgi:hypothetical protein
MESRKKLSKQGATFSALSFATINSAIFLHTRLVNGIATISNMPFFSHIG